MVTGRDGREMRIGVSVTCSAVLDQRQNATRNVQEHVHDVIKTSRCWASTHAPGLITCAHTRDQDLSRNVPVLLKEVRAILFFHITCMKD